MALALAQIYVTYVTNVQLIDKAVIQMNSAEKSTRTQTSP